MRAISNPVGDASRRRGIGLGATAAIAGLAALQAAACESPTSVATVAVAANFREAAEEIGTAFGAATGHGVRFSFGSTGQLFVQIAQGAPFDAFLAADRARAAKAVREGYAVAGSRFTYATGRIVLYSVGDSLVTGPETLTHGAFNRLAIAEPASAPYGAAAVETLRALDVLDEVEDRIVRGMNVAQAHQFVRSGNADLGFVALSLAAAHANGSRWLVPANLHSPIEQDAVLLKRGEGNPAARAFLDFLKHPDTEAILRKHSYGVGG